MFSVFYRKVILYSLLFTIFSASFGAPLCVRGAATELYYDDGVWLGSGLIANYLGVSFNGPSAGLYLVEVKLWGVPADTGSATIYVTESDHTTVITSFPATITTSSTWSTFSVPGGGVVVPQNFFVIVSNILDLHVDSAGGGGHSYGGESLPTMAWIDGYDLMLRAIVDTSIRSVGGEILSVDKIALLTPYIALTLVLANAATLVLKRRG